MQSSRVYSVVTGTRNAEYLDLTSETDDDDDDDDDDDNFTVLVEPGVTDKTFVGCLKRSVQNSYCS
jgi:hypothetical protein